ncbi:MAG: hypothetical protein ABH826_03440 [Patescibacteria group bacterium]
MKVDLRLLPRTVTIGQPSHPTLRRQARPVLAVEQLPDHAAQQIFSLALPSGRTIPIRHGHSLFYNYGPAPEALAHAIENYSRDTNQTIDEVEIWSENFLAVITRHDQHTEQARKCLFLPVRLIQSDAGLYPDKPADARFTTTGSYQPAGLLSLESFTAKLRQTLDAIPVYGPDQRKTERNIQCYLSFHGLNVEDPGHLFGFTELGKIHDITPERPRQIVLSDNRLMRQAIKWQFTPIKANVNAVLARLLQERHFLTAPEVTQALIEAGLAEEKDMSSIFPLLMLFDFLYISEAHMRSSDGSRPSCPDAHTYLDLGTKSIRLLLDRNFFQHQRYGSSRLVEPVLFSSYEQYQVLEGFVHELVANTGKRCWPIVELQQHLAQKQGVWVSRSQLELIYGALGYHFTADDFFVYGDLDSGKIISERVALLLEHSNPLTAREVSRLLDLPLQRARSALADRTRFDLLAGNKYRLHSL